MADSKTAHQVAIELVKAIRAELDAQRELAKSAAAPAKTEYTPQQAAQALGAAVRQQIKEYEGELVKMRQREADALKKSLYGMPSGAPPAGKLGKTVFEMMEKSKSCTCDSKGNCQVCRRSARREADDRDIIQGHQDNKAKKAAAKMSPANEDTEKSETFLDPANANDSKKRDVTIGDKNTVTPADKKSKKIEAKGSGGETKLGKEALGSTNVSGDKPGKPGDKPATSAVAKPPAAAALKPAGTPGAKAGTAPKVPEVPKAPGMTKEELDKMMSKPPAAPASAKSPSRGIPSNPGNPNAKMNMGNAFNSLNTPPPVKKEELDKMIGTAPAAPASARKPLGIPSNPGNPNAKMNMGNAFNSLNTPPAAPPAPMSPSKSPALAAVAAKKNIKS